MGDAARRQAVTSLTNTVYSAKRFIGCTFTQRKDEAAKMPYKVVEGKDKMVLLISKPTNASTRDFSKNIG